jgi:hypothetical protein
MYFLPLLTVQWKLLKATNAMEKWTAINSMMFLRYGNYE